MKLFTMEGCQKCVILKEYLIENKIAFEEHDAKELLTDPIGKTLTLLPVIEDHGNWIQGLIPGREWCAKNYMHI